MSQGLSVALVLAIAAPLLSGCKPGKAPLKDGEALVSQFDRTLVGLSCVGTDGTKTELFHVANPVTISGEGRIIFTAGKIEGATAGAVGEPAQALEALAGGHCEFGSYPLVQVGPLLAPKLAYTTNFTCLDVHPPFKQRILAQGEARQFVSMNWKTGEIRHPHMTETNQYTVTPLKLTKDVAMSCAFAPGQLEPGER